ncbi:MAG: AAA family ATPase [Planctomycetes bacterium]|nr:AAA family ATPase [Planctomycetota bacterium]
MSCDETPALLRLPPERIRWRCPREWLPFSDTRDLAPEPGIVGQDEAIEALRYGLEIEGPGQHVFVRGLDSSGRLTLVQKLLEELAPRCQLTCDRAYVPDFEAPDRPRWVELPRGSGALFARAMRGFARRVRRDLPDVLRGEGLAAQTARFESDWQRRAGELERSFQAQIAPSGLGLVRVEQEGGAQLAMVPLHEGQPLGPDEIAARERSGPQGAAEVQRWQEALLAQRSRFQEFVLDLQELHEERTAALQEMRAEAARAAVERYVERLRKRFPHESVQRYLDGVVRDLLENRLDELEGEEDFTEDYLPNPIQAREREAECPIIVESIPNVANLLGSVEIEALAGGGTYSDHRSIRGGALLQADGGFLILEARELLAEPESWRALVRALRSDRVEILPREGHAGPLLKPEPIPIRTKVILIGDPELYQLLDAEDAYFPSLFKVLVDFEGHIARDARGARQYAGVIARFASEARLPAFTWCAVARLVEHGSSLAACEGLSTRLGRIADLARETAFWARREGAERCEREHVRTALRQARRRADLPARRFRRMVKDGVVTIEVRGRRQGQINALATLSAGSLTYGIPARITASVGPGERGAIDIEGLSQLGGSIHTKGFHILQGLLQNLLRVHHPLAFTASLAFEQTYGGIDGDSASAAEICCLISALAEVPLRQDLALTGAIDQHGRVQAIGAVNEKIEGFFDVCAELGATEPGSPTEVRGVVIPAANVTELMLREEVVDACVRGAFAIYAASDVRHVLELFTGLPFGACEATATAAPDSLLERARRRAEELWRASQGIELDRSRGRP